MNFAVEFMFGLGIALSTGFLLAVLVCRPAVNMIMDRFVKRLLKDPYQENLAEMVNVFKKVGLQNVLEADLRTNTGKVLERPLGSPLHFSPWEQLLFNPVYLSRLPIIEACPIDLSVVLGPQAKRPLALNSPILISGMGYGCGLSLQTKLALAKASKLANAATNTGLGPFLPEERNLAQQLIIQYHPSRWRRDETVLRQADMIEIQLGCGALGALQPKFEPNDIDDKLENWVQKGETDSPKEAKLPRIANLQELTQLVTYLREVTNGVPIGVKIGATHYLEQELAVITAAGIDFLSIDGAEAGIQWGPTILADSMGLPTLPALCRAKRYLLENDHAGKISLIISGGLTTPGHFLKALALGADAVAIGTIALAALAHVQVSKIFPWKPLTELLFEQGKAKKKLQVDAAAQSLANFLKSCEEEMIMGMRALGRTSLQQLSEVDLCALSFEVAQITGVQLGLFAPETLKN